MTISEQTHKDYRSGFVAIVGRPNVGKSTLINQLVGKKIAITSPVAQTTRNRLRAILTTSKAQLVMIDTPGIHKPHHLLGERLVNSARSAIGEVDAILFLVEGCHKPGKGDAFIIELLKKQRCPVIVALNKWDLILNQDNSKSKITYTELLKSTNWPIYTCSAKSGDGCIQIVEELISKLPKGPQLYPTNVVCDQPQKVLLSELIREQVLMHTREELPHSVAVNIERIEEINLVKGKNDTRTAILATVLVEKKTQKGIIIGKGGSMLKTIGQGARLQIQKLVEGPVYLELFVKIVPNWRSKPARLKELGY